MTREKAGKGGGKEDSNFGGPICEVEMMWVRLFRSPRRGDIIACGEIRPAGRGKEGGA